MSISLLSDCPDKTQIIEEALFGGFERPTVIEDLARSLFLNIPDAETPLWPLSKAARFARLYDGNPNSPHRLAVSINYNNQTNIKIPAARIEEHFATMPKGKVVGNSLEEYKKNIPHYEKISDTIHYPESYTITHKMKDTYKTFIYNVFVVWFNPKFVYNIYKKCQVDIDGNPNKRTIEVGEYSVKFRDDEATNYLVLPIDTISYTFGYTDIEIKYIRNSHNDTKENFPFVPESATPEDLNTLKSLLRSSDPTSLPNVFMMKKLTNRIYIKNIGSKEDEEIIGPEDDSSFVELKDSNLFKNFYINEKRLYEVINSTDDESQKPAARAGEILKQKADFLRSRVQEGLEAQRELFFKVLSNRNDLNLRDITAQSTPLTLDNGDTIDPDMDNYGVCLKEISCDLQTLEVLRKNQNFVFDKSYEEIKDTSILIK